MIRFDDNPFRRVTRQKRFEISEGGVIQRNQEVQNRRKTIHSCISSKDISRARGGEVMRNDIAGYHEAEIGD